jgi:transposase
MERRQICWAHLIRRMVSFSERDGPTAAFGKELLEYAGIIFEYWHSYKDDKLSREQLVSRMAPVRQQVEALLARAVAAGIKGVSGSCANMSAHKEALWTFVDHDGVDPTNNHVYAARGISVVMPRPGSCRVGAGGAHRAERVSISVGSEPA